MAIETQYIKGLEGVLQALESLPPEIVSKNGGVVLKALRKGGRVIVKQARANVQQIVQDDALDDSTGALVKAIGTSRSRTPKSYGANEVVLVKIRRASKVRNMSPAQYGRLLELGDEKQTAKPWMAPAYYSKRQEALDTIVDELNTGIIAACDKAMLAAGV